MKKLKEYLSKRLSSFILTKNYKQGDGSVKFPKSSSVYGNIFNGRVVIGSHCKVMRSEFYGNIDIGNHTALNGPNLNIYAGEGEVSIGNFCSIARNVSIQLDGHNYKKITSYQIFKNFFKTKNEQEVVRTQNICIENDVWIGANAMIYGGITIGNGAVVGSNSFVNKDVPPYAIVVGSPAQIINYRFDTEMIDKLQELKWWDWDDKTLQNNQSVFENELTKADMQKIRL